jgi:hypothetical protein
VAGIDNVTSHAKQQTQNKQKRSAWTAVLLFLEHPGDPPVFGTPCHFRRRAATNAMLQCVLLCTAWRSRDKQPLRHRVAGANTLLADDQLAGTESVQAEMAAAWAREGSSSPTGSHSFVTDTTNAVGTEPPECMLANLDGPVAASYQSRRILVVAWKGAFRGAEGLQRTMNTVSKHKFEVDRRDIWCTPDAETIQLATSRAQMEHVVRPLERANFSVDVLLSAHLTGCAARPNATEQHLRKKEQLLEWYSPNVLRNSSEFYGDDDYAGQVDASLRTMRLVKAHLADTKVQYAALLLWRFDVAPMHPLLRADLDTANEPAQNLTELAHRLSDSNESSYALWAREFLAVFGTDQLVNVPGAMMPCMLSVAEDSWLLQQSKPNADIDLTLPKMMAAWRVAEMRRSTAGGQQPAVAGSRLLAPPQVLTSDEAATLAGSINRSVDYIEAARLIRTERSSSLAHAFGAAAIFRGPVGVGAFASGPRRTCARLRDIGTPELSCELADWLRRACKIARGALTEKNVSEQAIDTLTASWMVNLTSYLDAEHSMVPPCTARSFLRVPGEQGSLAVACNDCGESLEKQSAFMPNFCCADPWLFADLNTLSAGEKLADGQECPVWRDVPPEGLLGHAFLTSGRCDD